MSRTVGAKDKKPRKSPVRKPKKIILTNAELEVAAKLGITPEQLAKEKLELMRLKRKAGKQKINWENLARNLQKALRDEMDENQKRAHDIEALLFKVKSLEHQVIGFQAVISYLESKNGNDPV